MNLPLHTLADEAPSPILNITFNSSGSLFATATTDGWVVYGTEPLRIISKRGEMSQLGISRPDSDLGPATRVPQGVA